MLLQVSLLGKLFTAAFTHMRLIFGMNEWMHFKIVESSYFPECRYGFSPACISAWLLKWHNPLYHLPQILQICRLFFILENMFATFFVFIFWYPFSTLVYLQNDLRIGFYLGKVRSTVS
jgi:hypothetical protein